MDKYNAEHYWDETAATAVSRADKYGLADKRAREFLTLLHKMAKVAGYKITDRITFTDIMTGRIYK